MHSHITESRLFWIVLVIVAFGALVAAIPDGWLRW